MDLHPLRIVTAEAAPLNLANWQCSQRVFLRDVACVCVHTKKLGNPVIICCGWCTVRWNLLLFLTRHLSTIAFSGSTRTVVKESGERSKTLQRVTSTNPRDTPLQSRGVPARNASLIRFLKYAAP